MRDNTHENNIRKGKERFAQYRCAHFILRERRNDSNKNRSTLHDTSRHFTSRRSPKFVAVQKSDKSSLQEPNTLFLFLLLEKIQLKRESISSGCIRVNGLARNHLPKANTISVRMTAQSGFVAKRVSSTEKQK